MKKRDLKCCGNCKHLGQQILGGYWKCFKMNWEITPRDICSKWKFHNDEREYVDRCLIERLDKNI